MFVQVTILIIATQAGVKMLRRDHPYIFSVDRALTPTDPLLLQNYTLNDMNKIFFMFKDYY